MKLIKKSFRLLFALQLFTVVLMSCNFNKVEPVKSNGVSDTLKSVEAANPYITNDQSAMDMSYYPQDYPILKMNGADSAALIARVIYSRPQKKGRVIFGTSSRSLREYGKEWRLGANEATEIEFFKDVMINGKKIEKGRYIIYSIPYADRWTIILNTNLYTWGLHMDQSKDIFKVDVPLELQAPALEDFTMVFEKASYGADLIMAWDNVKARLRIITNPQ
jgi:hypothetical protein